MSVWRAPGGGEPEQEIEVSELTEQLFARATLDVAVEQAEVADEEDAADGGDDGQEPPSCPRLGTRQARCRLYWLRLTSLCERASKKVLTNWTLLLSVGKSMNSKKCSPHLYGAMKILEKFQIRANSQLFKPAIALPAATEGLHWREFSVKAGKARVRLRLNPKFTNFKPPSSKYTEGFSQAHKRWQGTPKHPHCQEYCCYHQLFSSSMSTLSESPPSSSSLWDHDLEENRLTCSVPLNLGRISALAQFVESHHCKRVTRVHLQLAHLMMIYI